MKRRQVLASAAFRGARRVMKSGARLGFGVPGQLRHNSIATCVQQAVENIFPADPPNYLTKQLHGYAQIAMIENDLPQAGLTDAIYTIVGLPHAVRSTQDATVGYCLGILPRPEIEACTVGSAEHAVEAVTTALKRRFGAGAIDLTMLAQVITAAG